MPSHSGLITVMTRAARKAAPRVRRDFGEVEQLQVSRKGPADFVSMADERAEQALVEELRHARPDWSLSLEEGGTIEGRYEMRIATMLDPDSIEELDARIESIDPLAFRDSKRYPDRLRAAFRPRPKSARCLR